MGSALVRRSVESIEPAVDRSGQNSTATCSGDSDNVIKQGSENCIVATALSSEPITITISSEVAVMDTSRGHNGTHKRDACVSSLQTEEERERHKKGVGKLELITGCPPEGSRENSQSKTAVLRLQNLLGQLDKGETPNMIELRATISFAADVLSTDLVMEEREEDNLNSVSDAQVRQWLATTFTRQESAYIEDSVALKAKERFRAVANTIIIGKFFENIVKEPSTFTLQYPDGLADIFDKQLDRWEFEIFRVESLSRKHTLRHVGYELFKKHNLFDSCNISQMMFDKFLARIEADYGNHGNSYHNATHAADVAQTVHYLIHSTGLEDHLTHLEVLSLLLSAIIHDVNHPGTSNAFQIMEMSHHALVYNDRSVLENHHLSHTFSLLQEGQFNILSGLSPDEFKLVRGLIIDMVLATDMSTHFDLLKRMRQTLSCPNSAAQLLSQERSTVFCLILHLADISHPGKAWEEHVIWSERLCEEFFHQGDLEKKLGRCPSPLCDRENTNLPESQLGFIEYIVSSSYDVCGTLLETVISQPSNGSHDMDSVSHDTSRLRVWEKHIEDNKAMWRSKCTKKADGDSKSELTNGHSNSNTEQCHHGDKKTEQSVDVEKTDGSKVIANGDIQHGEIPPINKRECNDALMQC